jgi:hypothetical protein
VISIQIRKGAEAKYVPGIPVSGTDMFTELVVTDDVVLISFARDAGQSTKASTEEYALSHPACLIHLKDTQSIQWHPAGGEFELRAKDQVLGVFRTAAAAKEARDALVDVIHAALRRRTRRTRRVRRLAFLVAVVFTIVGAMSMLLASVRPPVAAPLATAAPVAVQTTHPIGSNPRTVTNEDRLALAGFRGSEKPIDFAIKLGSGKRQIFAFVDPQCSGCRQTDPILEEVAKDFTVYLMPVAFQPNSDVIARRVMCADDRAAAWRAAIHDKLTTGATDCKAAEGVDKLSALYLVQGYQNTPTIVSDDGRVINTVASADDLRAWMAQAK